MNYEQVQNQIIKLIRSMTGAYNLYNIWRDFLVLASCTISNSVDKRQWEKREKMYMDTIKKYSKSEADKFAEMLALVVMGLDGPRMGDFLGELYMNLGVSNKDIGQFFTPYDVSKMMSQFLGTDPNDDGIITLNEPTCGSGGMIIAYAETLKKEDINYQEKLRVVCQDLDHDVVKMAYIQLSLLGIDAVIMQGNTLTLQMNEFWYTPMHFINLAKEKQVKQGEQTKRMVDAMQQIIALEKPVKDEVANDFEQTTIFEFLEVAE